MGFDFKEDLLSKVYCRLKPSPIHGVGVFAIRAIPKGINPLEECRKFEFGSIALLDITKDPAIPETIKQLVIDMCPENDGHFDIAPFSLNEIGLSYYLNHSRTPNMRCDEESGDFFTLREIVEGEELTVDYGTYGALNL